MRTVAPGSPTPASLVTVPVMVVAACASATDAAQNRSANAAKSFPASCVKMVRGELGGWEPGTGRAIDMLRFNIRLSFSIERRVAARCSRSPYRRQTLMHTEPRADWLNRFPERLE